jgi:hypothetical protein
LKCTQKLTQNKDGKKLKTLKVQRDGIPTGIMKKSDSCRFGFALETDGKTGKRVKKNDSRI